MHDFSQSGCTNCGWTQDNTGGAKMFDFVTANYEGFLTLIKPRESWVVRAGTWACTCACVRVRVSLW